MRRWCLQIGSEAIAPMRELLWRVTGLATPMTPTRLPARNFHPKLPRRDSPVVVHSLTRDSNLRPLSLTRDHWEEIVITQIPYDIWERLRNIGGIPNQLR
jgi:hypothetical protein